MHDLFAKQNDDTPFILKTEQYLRRHRVRCSSSFIPAELNQSPEFVKWRITLIRSGLHTNTQHFEHWHHISFLPNYSHLAALSNEQYSKQKELITLATHYGLAVKKLKMPYNDMVRLERPSIAHIIAGLMVKSAAIYCENFSDWCDKKQKNLHNIQAYDEYQDAIKTAVRFNSLFSFQQQCELDDILHDF